MQFAKPAGWLWLALLPLLAVSAGAEIYRWTDAQGRVHFGDKPREQDSAQSVSVEVNTYQNVTYESLGDEIPEPARREKVIMYGASWCGVCKKAREYFQANDIPYVEYDIDDDPDARQRYDRMDASGVPVILVGDQRMNGFSASGFERMYSG